MIRPAALALLLVGAAPAAALEITQVYHEPRSFDPTRGETLTVHFRLSAPAEAALRVFDGRDLAIRTVSSPDELPAGEHTLTWDGKDFAGRPVPPEAYVYTLEATTPAGERVAWDLTDLTGADPVTPAELRWNPVEGVVRYRLPEASRIRIRIGLARGGPLLRTLVDWVPRSAGVHEEAWDGKDAAGVLELRDHPSLTLVPRAFSLPDNAVLVTPEPRDVQLIEDVPADAPRRERRPKRGKRMFDYPHQSIESRRDFPIRLVLPGELERTADGLPIVTGSLPVRLEVDDADLASVLNERCEAVFFVDGRFVFENEVGFLPMTWTWEPRGANEGVHYVSANLRGYEGHFGVTTLKVYLKSPETRVR